MEALLDTEDGRQLPGLEFLPILASVAASLTMGTGLLIPYDSN